MSSVCCNAAPWGENWNLKELSKGGWNHKTPWTCESTCVCRRCYSECANIPVNVPQAAISPILTNTARISLGNSPTYRGLVLLGGSQWTHPMSLAALSHLEMIPEDESYYLGRRRLLLSPQYGVRRRTLKQWQPDLGVMNGDLRASWEDHCSRDRGWSSLCRKEMREMKEIESQIYYLNFWKKSHQKPFLL